jgi:hypothetical protein
MENSMSDNARFYVQGYHTEGDEALWIVVDREKTTATDIFITDAWWSEDGVDAAWNHDEAQRQAERRNSLEA